MEPSVKSGKENATWQPTRGWGPLSQKPEGRIEEKIKKKKEEKEEDYNYNYNLEQSSAQIPSPRKESNPFSNLGQRDISVAQFSGNFLPNCREDIDRKWDFVINATSFLSSEREREESIGQVGFLLFSFWSQFFLTTLSLCLFFWVPFEMIGLGLMWVFANFFYI